MYSRLVFITIAFGQGIICVYIYTMYVMTCNIYLSIYIYYISIFTILTPYSGLRYFSQFLEIYPINFFLIITKEKKTPKSTVVRKDWKWGWQIWMIGLGFYMCNDQWKRSGWNLASFSNFPLWYWLCIYIYTYTSFLSDFSLPWGGSIQIFKILLCIQKKNRYDKIRFVMVTRQTFMIENNSLILTKKNYALVLIVRKKLCIPTFIRVQKCLKITNYDLWVFNVESQTKFMCKCCSCFFLFLSTEYTIEDLS